MYIRYLWSTNRSMLIMMSISFCKKKPTIHQLTTILSTSKNVLFPGHNHRCWWPDTLIIGQAPAKAAPVVSRWLWPGNRTFFEVDNMVVSWWIVLFFALCMYSLSQMLNTLVIDPWSLSIFLCTCVLSLYTGIVNLKNSTTSMFALPYIYSIGKLHIIICQQLTKTKLTNSSKYSSWETAGALFQKFSTLGDHNLCLTIVYPSCTIITLTISLFHFKLYFNPHK